MFSGKKIFFELKINTRKKTNEIISIRRRKEKLYNRNGIRRKCRRIIALMMKKMMKIFTQKKPFTFNSQLYMYILQQRFFFLRFSFQPLITDCLSTYSMFLIRCMLLGFLHIIFLRSIDAVSIFFFPQPVQSSGIFSLNLS